LFILQPDIFIYNWRSCCWYFGIYRLERICILLTSHVIYFSWAHSQSKIFNPHILWFLESCANWWLSRWSNGRFLCSLHLSFVIIRVLKILLFMKEEISLDKIGRHTYK